jgi:hypothetical protein
VPSERIWIALKITDDLSTACKELQAAKRDIVATPRHVIQLTGLWSLWRINPPKNDPLVSKL